MGAPPVEMLERHAPAGAPVPPLLATKLVLPVPPPLLVARPRLTARLPPAATDSGPRGQEPSEAEAGPRGGLSREQGAAHSAARLAILIAPAGSGKSSLLSQWCQQQPEGSVAWLSLDPEESDPARFLRYLCAALETVAPAAAAPVRSLLQADQRPSPQYVLTLLLNGLSALEQPVTLVLDDYHRIEARAVHDLVTFLVEHLPPTLFLILASRSDPPLPLPRLRLRGQLIEIRAGDLRFTLEEATQFLNEQMGLTLPPELVDRLAERTEGWIAALQMAALSLQGEADAGGFLDAFTGSDRYLVDYLSEEVLRRQPPEVQAFLGKTAILKRLCGPLCEAVTGAPGGQAMLERLEAANLFLIPLDRERRWYRYHHLFADVLRSRLLPEEGEPLAVLHERAAAWYEAEGMVDEAIEHALAGGQFERAGGLIERRYQSMWRQGEWRTLERWLRALPPDLIQTGPHLSLALAGLCVYTFRVAEAEQVLNDCRFEPEADTTATRDLQGKLLIVRAATARLQGDTERTAVLSRQALDLLPADSHIFRGGALLNLGILHEGGGDLVAAGEAFAAAALESQKAGLSEPRLRASYASGQLREAEGALQEAARLYHDALEYAREGSILHTPAAALLFAGLGRLCYQRNDLPAAAASLAEGLERLDSEFADINPIYAVPCCFELLRLQTAVGNTAAADAMFERLADIARAIEVPCLEPMLALLRVWKVDPSAASPALGVPWVPGRGADSGGGPAPGPAELTAAWLTAFEARTADEPLPSVPIPEVRVPDIRGLEIVTWAQLRLAQGETVTVKARLERFLEAMVKQGRHGSALEVRLLLATLHWQTGGREPAIAVLEPALALAEREGYVRVFVEAGPALIPVLRQAAAQGIRPEYVGKLLSALGDAEPGAGARPRGSGSALIEPLSDRELEVLRLLAARLRAAEIAAQLFVSEGTVRRHLHNLYGKLGVTSGTSAAARGRALGLL